MCVRRRRKAPRRRKKRNHLHVVKWANRRSDHPFEAYQAPDVWKSKARSTPSTTDWRIVGVARQQICVRASSQCKSTIWEGIWIATSCPSVCRIARTAQPRRLAPAAAQVMRTGSSRELPSAGRRSAISVWLRRRDEAVNAAGSDHRVAITQGFWPVTIPTIMVLKNFGTVFEADAHRERGIERIHSRDKVRRIRAVL